MPVGRVGARRGRGEGADPELAAGVGGSAAAGAQRRQRADADDAAAAGAAHGRHHRLDADEDAGQVQLQDAPELRHRHLVVAHPVVAAGQVAHRGQGPEAGLHLLHGRLPRVPVRSRPAAPPAPSSPPRSVRRRPLRQPRAGNRPPPPAPRPPRTVAPQPSPCRPRRRRSAPRGHPAGGRALARSLPAPSTPPSALLLLTMMSEIDINAMSERNTGERWLPYSSGRHGRGSHGRISRACCVPVAPTSRSEPGRGSRSCSTTYWRSSTARILGRKPTRGP